jgi:hypothetical protein
MDGATVEVALIFELDGNHVDSVRGQMSEIWGQWRMHTGTTASNDWSVTAMHVVR